MVERIFHLMDAEGVKAVELSNATGINSSTFTQWKKGLQKPSVEAIIKIAEFFGVTTDYLLDEERIEEDAHSDKLIESNFRGIKVWNDNQFLSAKERSRAKSHFAELLLRYKEFINAYSNEKTNINGTAGINYSHTDKPLEALDTWVSLLPDYLIGEEPKNFRSETKKSAAEKLGDALMQAFIDAGKLKPGEPLTDELKQYAENLVRAALASK